MKPLLELGWRPRYSNDEMFRESYEWFLANRSELDKHPAGSAHRSKVRQGLLNLLRKIS